MVYQFKLDHNATEATKNIFCVKVKGAVDYSTVNKWFKKFCLGCKYLDEQARAGTLKSLDSEVMLKSIKAELASSTQRVSGELGISQSSEIHHLYKKHPE